MNRTLLILLSLLLPLVAVSQQKPQYSQYVINNYLLNPAIAGIEDYTDVKLGVRNQWSGIEGAPTTFYFSAHAHLSDRSAGVGPGSIERKTPAFAADRETRSIYRNESYKPRHGAGLLVLRDELGPFVRTEANVSYAYHTPLANQVKLSAGVAVGVTQTQVQGSSLHFANAADAVASERSTWRPNLAAGLWLYSNIFYLGFSGAELLSSTVTFNSETGEAGESRNHFFATGAYKLPLTNELVLIPSFMVKWLNPLPISVDYNVRALYRNRVWAGVSYRQSDNIAFLAGLTLSHMFDLGYSYDKGVSALNQPSQSVVLGVRLYNKRKQLNPGNLW